MGEVACLLLTTFGSILNTECHLKTYTRRAGLYSYADSQHQNKELLLIKLHKKQKYSKVQLSVFTMKNCFYQNTICSTGRRGGELKNHKMI
jgi:hypothetical protein